MPNAREPKAPCAGKHGRLDTDLRGSGNGMGTHSMYESRRKHK